MSLIVWNEYVNVIKKGEILVCKCVKQVVERYFFDLNDFCYEFDMVIVEWFIVFFWFCFYVKGLFWGQLIDLELWQQFVFVNLLGFKVREIGCCEYSSVFIEVLCKNVKFIVVVMLVNWFLVMEKGQQDIYMVVVSWDQV